MNRVVKGLLFALALFLILFLVFRNPDKSLEELKALYTDAQSEWVEVNGMDVHYKKEGSGPAVMLIHGTGASLHTWDEWTSVLQDSFTVYRMDIPAFGLTGPAPDADYTMGAYVDFIKEFAVSQRLDSFAIAGNSLGGYIAWAYTVLNPGDITKLILIDAAGYPHEGGSDALAFKIASNPILSPIMKQITPKSFIKKNLIQVYGDDSKISDDLVTRYHDMALRDGNRQAFIDRVHTRHTDMSDRIKEISCPTLILWGAEDTWVDPEDAAQFKRDISDAQLIIYEGVGHVPMEEAPRRSANDALLFLKDAL